VSLLTSTRIDIIMSKRFL